MESVEFQEDSVEFPVDSVEFPVDSVELTEDSVEFPGDAVVVAAGAGGGSTMIGGPPSAGNVIGEPGKTGGPGLNPVHPKKPGIAMPPNWPFTVCNCKLELPVKGVCCYYLAIGEQNKQEHRC